MKRMVGGSFFTFTSLLRFAHNKKLSPIPGRESIMITRFHPDLPCSSAGLDRLNLLYQDISLGLITGPTVCHTTRRFQDHARGGFSSGVPGGDFQPVVSVCCQG